MAKSQRRRDPYESVEGFIKAQEYDEIVAAKKSARSRLFIGGRVNKESKTITLWLGDGKVIHVPFSTFPVSGDGTAPNFNKFAIIDYGQTVQLGKYEAAGDAILDECKE